MARTHRVVIQVTQNDPVVMNMALNNAENLTKFYKDKGDKIEIEFVAYGAGLNMVRSDTSPVKERLAMLSGKNMVFTGCGNTMANQSKAENKEITLVPEARIVPTGIAQIVELRNKAGPTCDRESSYRPPRPDDAAGGRRTATASTCAACVGAADCDEQHGSCVAACRARYFVVDPNRDGCVAACSTRAMQCGRVAASACVAQHLCR